MKGNTESGFVIRTEHHGKMEVGSDVFADLPISESDDRVSEISDTRIADVRCAVANNDVNLDVMCTIIRDAHDFILPTIEAAPGVELERDKLSEGAAFVSIPDDAAKTIRVRVDSYDYENVREKTREVEAELEAFGLETSVLADVFPEADTEVWNVIAVQ